MVTRKLLVTANASGPIVVASFTGDSTLLSFSVNSHILTITYNAIPIATFASLYWDSITQTDVTPAVITQTVTPFS